MTGGRIEVGADPARVLLDDAEIWLERGEHVSLVGPNGAGKTTLIDTLAGVRPLAAGKLSTGHNVKIGHLSQHADELGTGPGGRARTVAEAAAVHTGLTPQKARALLGRFLFSGEDGQKPLDGLSGGERRRLSLAILVASGANVLILDEPTNHLDIESREALEDALLSFEGALLLVSHDRALLEAVGTRTVAVHGRHAALLRGRLAGVRARARGEADRRAGVEGQGGEGGQRGGGRKPRRRRARGRAEAGEGEGGPQGERAPRRRPPAPAGANCAGERLAAATAAALAEGGGNGGAQRPGLSKNARRRVRELEREIEQAEAALKRLEAELADPAAWATAEATAQSTAAPRRRQARGRRGVRALGGARLLARLALDDGGSPGWRLCALARRRYGRPRVMGKAAVNKLLARATAVSSSSWPMPSC